MDDKAGRVSDKAVLACISAAISPARSTRGGGGGARVVAATHTTILPMGGLGAPRKLQPASSTAHTDSCSSSTQCSQLIGHMTRTLT